MAHPRAILAGCGRLGKEGRSGRGAFGTSFCYLLAIANELKLDLSAAFEAKKAKNVEKYPVEHYRGLFGPEDPNRKEH